MGSQGTYRGKIPSFEKDMKKLMSMKDTCDVEFIIGKDRRRLYAHRPILISRCALFKAMFTKVNNKEKSLDGPIVLTDADPDAYSLMLEYLYTNSICVNESDFEKVGVLIGYAVEYGLEDLRKVCLDYLSDQINERNCCHAMEIAIKYSQNHLQERVSKFIEKNIPQLLRNKELLSLPEPAMLFLIQSDYLNLDEIDVIQFVHKWATQKAFERSCTIPEAGHVICQYLRLGLLTMEELSSVEEENRCKNSGMISADLFARAWKTHALRAKKPDDVFYRPRVGTKRRN